MNAQPNADTMTGPDNGAQAGSPGTLQVFSWCFVLALGVLLAGPYGNVSPAGTLDPWIYTGYFQNFTDMMERFGVTYYVSRLPYVLPGMALYAVFTPAVANLVLNAVLLTGVIAPLFLVLHRQFGLTAALIGVAAATGNAWLASSIVWDYPDGPAIAYTLLGLWLAIAPPRFLPERWAMPLAGACWTMAGVTNLIAGVIIISSAVTAVIWRGRPVWRTALDLLALAAGAGLCLGIWCMISRVTLGLWNILGPQWEQLSYAAGNHDYLPEMWGRGYAWIKSAYRLLAPLVLLLAGGGVLLLPAYRASPHRRALLAAWTGLAVAAAIFGWAEFGADKVLLRVFYHSSYLVAPLLLCATTVSGLILHHLPAGRKFQTGLGFGLLVMLALPALNRGYHWLPRSMNLEWWALMFASFLVLGLGVRRWVLGPVLGLLSLGFVLNGSMVSDNTVAGFAFHPKEAVFVADSSEKILARNAAYRHEVAADLILLLKNAGLRHHALHFWYDKDEPYLTLYDSLFALYLWGDRDYSDAFAHRSTAELRSWFEANSRLLHLTTDPARIAAHRALLEQRGFRWREVGAWNLGRQGPVHRVVIDEIELPAAAP